MFHDQEIAFTVSNGVLRPDGSLNLPDGTRGIAIIRELANQTPPMSRAEALAEIRRFGDEAVLRTNGTRFSRDELHDRG
ncbi:MAG: hypothetical protein ACKVS9_01750 [Phycisphaerae bacterium]